MVDPKMLLEEGEKEEGDRDGGRAGFREPR